MKNSNSRPARIAVIGPADCSPEIAALAYWTGRKIAENGAILLSGGRTGVMEASCRGAFEAGGITVGILPGIDPESSNRFVRIPLATGLGHARNAVIVQCADAVIAVSEGYGTLSEIALAMKMQKNVYGIRTRTTLEGIQLVQDPDEAISMIFRERELDGNH